jgi:hypothetical protein
MEKIHTKMFFLRTLVDGSITASWTNARRSSVHKKQQSEKFSSQAGGEKSARGKSWG